MADTVGKNDQRDPSLISGDSSDSNNSPEARSDGFPDTLKEWEKSYEFDSTLKGGYSLVYKVDIDSSLQYLYLKKGPVLREVSSTSRGILQKSLGYVGADFQDVFVLTRSFGPGNPDEIELIEKKTGNVLLKGTYIDIDEKDEVVLYQNDNDDTSMFLYEVRTGRNEKFKFPTDISWLPPVSGVGIVKITKQELVIRYATSNGNRTRVYKRS